MQVGISREDIAIIKQKINQCAVIQAAVIYGSSLYEQNHTDIDIGILLIPTKNNVIPIKIFKTLRKLRTNLSKKLSRDIDLVPHTLDELSNFNSPLYYPRYNPALCFGLTIKGKFSLKSTTELNTKAFTSPAATAAYILMDNRTITRRQLLRPSNSKNKRIFIAKLIHGPGNALTYLALKQKRSKYLANPSDFHNSFRIFDRLYQTDYIKILKWIQKLQKDPKKIKFRSLVRLLNWYEELVSLVLSSK